jgi:hypothetical protein
MGSPDQAENVSVTAVTAFMLELPLGLAVIYGIAMVLWYELLRSAVLSRVARRRSKHARMPALESWEAAELAEGERETEEREAAEASEPEIARRLYYLARKSAKAERDLAIQTANEAAERAVARIESRHREIATALDDEEAERLNGL